MRDSLDLPEPKGDPPAPVGSAGEDHEEKNFATFVPYVFKRFFTPENLWALVLFLILVVLIVFTTDDSPAWIYQGF